jgi:anti-anti-sigma factor
MDVVQHMREGVYDVDMRGQLTFGDHRAFRRILKKIEESDDIRNVVFRMDKLDFVDSAALGMLLLVYDAVEKKQKKLVIRGAKGQVKKMFALAHFQRLFVLE